MKNRAHLFCLFALLILSTTAGFAQPGSLDTSFNGSGKVFIPTSTRTHQASGVVQSDGKIVLLGHNPTTGATLFRLNSNGSLDTTFGSGGVVYSNWHFATTIPRGYPYDIAIQSIDGEERLVVVGSWTVPGTKKNTYTNDLRIDRYLSTGARDTSFGTNGTLIVNNPYALAVDIDYAGRIVAVGDAGAVTRRLRDGSIDTTFGPNNSGVTGAGGSMWDVRALADGSLVFAGSCASGRDTIMCVTKLKESGAVDETFGAAGKAFANFYGSGSFSRAFGMDLDDAGNIIAAGTARAAASRGSNPISYFAAAKFMFNGFPDTAFNSNGRVVGSMPGQAKSASWLPSGGMVMSGTASGPSGWDYYITSFTSIGMLDSLFGNSGAVFTNISSEDWTQKSIVYTDTSCSCKKLLVFGNSDGGSYGVSLARYLLD